MSVKADRPVEGRPRLDALAGRGRGGGGRHEDVGAVGGDGGEADELFGAAGLESMLPLCLRGTEAKAGSWGIGWPVLERGDEGDLAGGEVVVIGGAGGFGEARPGRRRRGGWRRRRGG